MEPAAAAETKRKFIERRRGISKTWIAYVLFMLLVFALTTPFMFHWPLEEQQGEQVRGGISTGLENVQQGNMQRRAAMFVLVGVSMVLLSRTPNRFQVNGLLGWTLIFYLGWILLSLTWSVDPTYTLRRVSVVYMMWFFAIIAAANSSLRELALLAVFVTGMSMAIGIGNELWLQTFDLFNQNWRFSGVFHSVTMGWNCSILALSTTYLLTHERRKKFRNILWCILLTAILFLLLTKTRTAVGAAIIALGFYGFKIVPTKKAGLIIIGVIIAISATYVTIGNKLLYYGGEATTLGRGESAKASVETLTGRMPLWKYSLKYAAKRPIQGYGFSSFINTKSILDINREVGWAASTLHSGYLNELMGTGFVGMSALVAMLVLALTRALWLSKEQPAFLFFAAVLIWLMINLFLEAALITGMSFMTFFCLTILVRLGLLPGEEWKIRW